MKDERNSRSIPVFPASQPAAKITKKVPIMNSPDPILLMKKKKGKFKQQIEGYRFSFGGEQDQKASKSRFSYNISSSQEVKLGDNKQSYVQPSMNKFKSSILPKNLTPQFSSKKKEELIRDQNKENFLSEVPSILQQILGQDTIKLIAPSKVEEKKEDNEAKSILTRQQSEASFADICLSEIERQNSQKELVVQSQKKETPAKSKQLQDQPKFKLKNQDSVDRIQKLDNENGILGRLKKLFHQPQNHKQKAQEKLLNSLNQFGSRFQSLSNLDRQKSPVKKKSQNDSNPEQNPPQNSQTQKKMKFNRRSKKRSNKKSEQKKVKYIPESFNAVSDNFFPIIMPKQDMIKYKTKQNQDQLAFTLFKKKKRNEPRPNVQNDNTIFTDHLFKNKLAIQKFRQLPGKNEFTQDDDVNTVNFNGLNQISYISKIGHLIEKHQQDSKFLKLSPINLLEDSQMKYLK